MLGTEGRTASHRRKDLFFVSQRAFELDELVQQVTLGNDLLLYQEVDEGLLHGEALARGIG